MSRHTWTLSISCALVLVLHTLRAPALAAQSILYGEEGRIFFLQNFQLGASAIFKSYAGYQHLFPRVVAFILTPISIDQVGWYYHLSALLAHGMLLFAILRFTEGRGLWVRVASLFASVLVPHAGEVYMNLPNTINLLTPVPILLYCALKSRGLKLVADVSVFMIAAMSGPAILIALPLMMGLSLIRREWNKLMVPAVLVSICQVALMNLSTRADSSEVFDLTMLFHVITTFFYPLFFGWILGQASMDQQLGVLLLFFIGIGIVIFRKHERPNLVTSSIWALAGLLWVAALVKGLGSPSWLHPLGGGHRYFWAPFVLVTIGILTGIRTPGLRNALVGLIFLSGVANYGLKLPIERITPAYKMDYSSGIMDVKVYPEAWDFRFKPSEPGNPDFFYEK